MNVSTMWTTQLHAPTAESMTPSLLVKIPIKIHHNNSNREHSWKDIESWLMLNVLTLEMIVSGCNRKPTIDTSSLCMISLKSQPPSTTIRITLWWLRNELPVAVFHIQCHFIAASHQEDHNSEFVEQAWRELLDPNTGMMHHEIDVILTQCCRSTLPLSHFWSVVWWGATSLQEEECHLHVVLAWEGVWGMLYLSDVADIHIGQVSCEYVCSLSWVELLWHCLIPVQVSCQWHTTQWWSCHQLSMGVSWGCGKLDWSHSHHSGSYWAWPSGSGDWTRWYQGEFLQFSASWGSLPSLLQDRGSHTCCYIPHWCKPSQYTPRRASLNCVLQSSVNNTPFPINHVWSFVIQQSQLSYSQGNDCNA